LKDLYYSYELKALRYETRSLEANQATYNTLDPLLIISDYSIGVQYALNKKLGNCSIRGIRNNNDFGEDIEFENQMISSGLGFAMQLKSPESFLQLDADYIYTGMRKVNGILSDKFMAVKKYSEYEQQFEYSFSNVNEFLFLINQFFSFRFSKIKFNIKAEFNVSNELKVEKSVPVSLNIQSDEVHLF
jgi:hypothetical protein